MGLEALDKADEDEDEDEDGGQTRREEEDKNADEEDEEGRVRKDEADEEVDPEADAAKKAGNVCRRDMSLPIENALLDCEPWGKKKLPGKFTAEAPAT